MNFSKGKYYLLLMGVIAFTLISCNKDDDNSTEEVNFSAENTALVARVDNIVEGSQNIVEAGYSKTEESDRMPNDIFGNCATFILNGGGSEGGTITIDFGTEGCQLLNAATVTGKIFLEYGPLVSGTRSITYEYQNFTYNGNGVAGGGTITRVLENSEGFPQSTVNEDITVSIVGTTVTAERTGLRVAEWIEGIGSGTWTDNVYRINGNWQTTLSNGFERTGVVTIPLRREMSCLFFVSGRIQVSQEGLTGELDFGDGDCDAIATIIFQGQEFPVILAN